MANGKESMRRPFLDFIFIFRPFLDFIERLKDWARLFQALVFFPFFIPFFISRFLVHYLCT